MSKIEKGQLCLSGGSRLAYVTAGDQSNPAVILLHGFPSASHTFRAIIPALADAAYVVAPDLPGFGDSDPLPAASFSALTEAILELLESLGIGARYIYVHDFGAPVALGIAMHEPEKVLGLIVQNANAHETGLGEQWAATRRYWANPTPANEAEATAHLTAEGTRQQYVGGLPEELACRIPPEVWEADWRVMALPGRLDMHKALIRDYGAYVQQFEAISAYLAKTQPEAVMLWGRHDPFFSLPEVLTWMEELPRMEAHILDGGHFLLETHASQAIDIMLRFVQRTTASP